MRMIVRVMLPTPAAIFFRKTLFRVKTNLRRKSRPFYARFTAKNLLMVVFLCFEDTSLSTSASVGILSVDISSELQFVAIWRVRPLLPRLYGFKVNVSGNFNLCYEMLSFP